MVAYWKDEKSEVWVVVFPDYSSENPKHVTMCIETGEVRDHKTLHGVGAWWIDEYIASIDYAAEKDKASGRVSYECMGITVAEDNPDCWQLLIEDDENWIPGLVLTVEQVKALPALLAQAKKYLEDTCDPFFQDGEQCSWIVRVE